jgi:hypothetical protein
MTVAFPIYSESSTTFKRVLPGEYLMTLTLVEDDIPEGFVPKTPRLKFVYRVDDITSDLEWPEDVTTAKDKREYVAALKGSDHWERVNYYPTMNAKQAIYKLLRGMIGRPITERDKLTPEQFVGQQYKVTISAVPWTMDDGRSGVSNKITVIKPANQAADLSWMNDDTEGFDNADDE